mmetsp:Transcript_69196/g.165923  ORF Transcript_69196/g.165923 Transcript_69196/m.165923 type:complete len:251 (+) Transcript_69196:296-1048(+)
MDTAMQCNPLGMSWLPTQQEGLHPHRSSSTTTLQLPHHCHRERLKAHPLGKAATCSKMIPTLRATTKAMGTVLTVLQVVAAPSLCHGVMVQKHQQAVHLGNLASPSLHPLCLFRAVPFPLAMAELYVALLCLTVPVATCRLASPRTHRALRRQCQVLLAQEPAEDLQGWAQVLVLVPQRQLGELHRGWAARYAPQAWVWPAWLRQAQKWEAVLCASGSRVPGMLSPPTHTPAGRIKTWATALQIDEQREC